ncbi:MAG: cytochrome c oxidase assembly protein [Geminicoccaceae bacterium]|nr:cytochrome c oxidase assembly protein [Geminicoccaceae bacterium]
MVGVIVAMLGLTAASVPLYSLFCAVTGYGGTTGVASGEGVAVGTTEVEVAFNADVDPHLPWRFVPKQRSMRVKVGEHNLAFYEAENRSDRPIVGQAIYNVTPLKIGYYFDKVQCFCFDEQTLKPGEKVDMPVTFYVDPEMLDDPSTQEVRQITLSYTFFIDEDATAALAAKSAAGATAQGS